MLVVGVACISFSSASYAALSPEGPRYLSRSCTAPDDNYVKYLPAGNITSFLAKAAIDGVREGISWYTNLGWLGNVGYLHTKSIRLKIKSSSPYYSAEYKHSESGDRAVETWHSYAGNLYDYDRVSLSTHYLNVYSEHWWYNPKRKKFESRSSNATTCTGSGSYSIADTMLGSKW
jgi:hypothetical protein